MTSAFEGRITIVETNFRIMDITGLPDSYIQEDSTISYVSYIHFTTPEIASSTTQTFSYKLISKIFAGDQYFIPHKITKQSNNHEGSAQIGIATFPIDYKPIPFPGRNHKTASALLQNYADSLILTIFPLETASPEIEACNLFTSQSLYIEDSLIFDIPNYCIYNHKFQGGIIVEPGGIIIIEDGASLVIDSQYIRSCNKMWKGFYVKKGGTLSIQNCIIENAQYGIQAERGSTIIAFQNVFLNNYIGLYISLYAHQNSPEDPSFSYVNLRTFANNLFIGSGEMLPGYAGQQPAPGSIPYAGIEANYVSSLIIPGDPESGYANMFENLSNGIIARHSSLYVGNTFFKDIVKDAQSPLLQQGFGIHVQNGKLTKIEGNTIGSFPPYSSHFYNVDVAIQSSGGHLDVSGQDIQNCRKGIVVASTKNRIIQIRDNFISSNHKGIEVFPITPLLGEIEDNSIYVTNQSEINACIEINDFPIPSGWKVNNNYLSLDGAGYGILHRVGYDLEVFENTIDLVPYTDKMSYGIQMEGSKNASIYCNLIKGTSQSVSSKKTTGIQATSSDDFTISCNDVDELGFGINFAGMNTSSRLRGNNFGNDHWDGLLLGRYPNDGNAVIGRQVHSGNTWEGDQEDFLHFAAIHLGPQALVSRSLFFIDTTTTLGINVSPPSDSSATDWFIFNDDSDTTFLCSVDSTCLNGVGSTTNLTNWDSLDLEIAQHNLGFEYFDNPLSWSGRLHTYHRLHMANIAGYPSELVDFLEVEASQNIGLFSRSLDSMSAILLCSGAYEEGLTEFPQRFFGKLTEFLFLDSLLLNDRSNDSIAEEMVFLLDSIAIFGYSFNLKDSIIQAHSSARLENLLADIESIPADSTWEEKLQFALLSSALFAKLDSLASSTDIFELASVCPDRYSDAVFYARSLIRVDSLQNYYDDGNLCTALFPRSENTPIRELPITISPNPTSSNFTVRSEMDISELQIFNVVGHRIYRIQSEGEKQLDCELSLFPPGMYYIITKSVSGQFGHGKLFKVD